jgi:hypothetical protein
LPAVGAPRTPQRQFGLLAAPYQTAHHRQKEQRQRADLNQNQAEWRSEHVDRLHILAQRSGKSGLHRQGAGVERAIDAILQHPAERVDGISRRQRLTGRQRGMVEQHAPADRRLRIRRVVHRDRVESRAAHQHVNECTAAQR